MLKNSSNKKIPSRAFIHCHAPAIFDRGVHAKLENQGVVCALLFATALEALSHDFVAFYGHMKSTGIVYYDGDHMANNYLTEAESQILERLRDAEINKVSVSKKLAIIRGLDGKKGIDDENFNLLILTRNRIAHLEPETTSLDEDAKTIDGRPEVFAQLRARGLAREPEHNEGWFESLETPEFCEWCMTTTRAVIQESLTALPRTQNFETFWSMFK